MAPDAPPGAPKVSAPGRPRPHTRVVLGPAERELLARLEGFPELDRHPELRPVLEGLVLRAVRRARSDRSATSTAVEDPEVELLRRRASKLLAALRSAREQADHVSRQETRIAGIASVYRTPQGLSPTDENAKAKRGMLEDIFQANLELKRGRRAS